MQTRMLLKQMKHLFIDYWDYDDAIFDLRRWMTNSSFQQITILTIYTALRSKTFQVTGAFNTLVLFITSSQPEIGNYLQYRIYYQEMGTFIAQMLKIAVNFNSDYLPALVLWLMNQR